MPEFETPPKKTVSAYAGDPKRRAGGTQGPSAALLVQGTASIGGPAIASIGGALPDPALRRLKGALDEWGRAATAPAPAPGAAANAVPSEAQRRADLRGFRAGLWGLSLPGHHELMADLRTRPDDTARMKLAVVEQSELLHRIAAGDPNAYVHGLGEKILETRRRRLQLKVEKNSMGLQVQATVSSRAKKCRSRLRAGAADLAELERSDTARLNMIRENSRDLARLYSLLHWVAGEDATALQGANSVDLAKTAEFLREEIAAARGRYPTERLEVFLARIDREPLARETMRAIVASGGEVFHRMRAAHDVSIAGHEAVLAGLRKRRRGAFIRSLACWRPQPAAGTDGTYERGAALLAQMKAHQADFLRHVEICESPEYAARVAVASHIHDWRLRHGIGPVPGQQ